jgi:phytoene synthase
VKRPDQQAINFEAVRASARRNAPDRYYAALFAPAAVRDDLIAVAAFTGEIERIGRHVRDAALAEMRIVWWRDALIGADGQNLSGNPVLDQFADVVRRHALSIATLEDYLSAHAHGLYDDPPADDPGLNLELRTIDGVPFALAAQILGVDIDEQAEDILKFSARAAGSVRIGLELPYTQAQGRTPLPEARSPNPFVSPQYWGPQIAWLAYEATGAMGAVRRLLAGQPRAFTTALLPLALVEPYFRALQNANHEPARDIVEIAPLARLWRIARAHWTGRL